MILQAPIKHLSTWGDNTSMKLMWYWPQISVKALVSWLWGNPEPSHHWHHPFFTTFLLRPRGSNLPSLWLQNALPKPHTVTTESPLPALTSTLCWRKMRCGKDIHVSRVHILPRSKYIHSITKFSYKVSLIHATWPSWNRHFWPYTCSVKKMTCEDPISGPKLGSLGPNLETEKYKKYPGFSIEHASCDCGIKLGRVLKKQNLNFGSENIVCVYIHI